MSIDAKAYDAALDRAHEHARRWLDSLGSRPVPPRRPFGELRATMGGPLPESPTAPEEVVDLLAELCEPGLMAMGSGRFFGWVIGGGLPAALAADWLVSAWDQNTVLRYATPATAAAEEVAGTWLLELLGLPPGSAVGFVTGAMMANFTCLAAARHAVLARSGWDVERAGLTGAPRLHVLVGAERHDTVDLALRYLGLGAPHPVAADAEGRIDPGALTEALQAVPPHSPLIVCLQAGNLHSGAFDPFVETVQAAHEHGAWVHVDGAFGLWAGAAPSLRHLLAGVEGCDSWATDAHKTLNVPYDCGVAIVADPVPLRASLGVRPPYLVVDDAGGDDPLEKVPEFSRRARGVTVWAALRSLGRSGVGELVETLAANARALGSGIAALDGAEVLNDVVYTQVSAAFGSDETTRAVTAALLSEGTAWMSGSRWHGREVLRVSVSNYSTDAADVERSIASLARAVRAVRSAPDTTGA